MMRNPVRGALLCRSNLMATSILCSALLAAPAFAQEAPPVEAAASVEAPTEIPEEAPAGEAIVVTGSRLVRTDLSAPSPIAVMNQEAIKLSGNVTIENTLNEFPQLASGNTSSVNNGGGSGVLTANLRGLGATRTLVLVNGRRFIPANADGSVDLATIPDALVERIEIITGGASAVYGSDAIAGAVNFILDTDFEGFETSYQYGQTVRDDGASHKVDATFGTGLGDGRGNVTLSASYTNRDEIFQADRAFARVPLDTVNDELVPGGSGSIPGTRVPLSEAQRASLIGVDLDPSGACTAITGIRFGANGTVLPYCQPQDAYNYAANNFLQRPLERAQISGIARYEIAEGFEAYAEAYFINSRNEFKQAPDSFTPLTPGAPSSTLLVPNYATSASLSPTVRQFFIDNAHVFDPDGDGTAAVVGAGRRADELGTRDYSYERTSYNLTGGLRGDFEMLGNDWAWDTFFQYQRNRTDTRIDGQISQTRLSLGLDSVVNADGEVVCRVQTLGCVPVSIFGLDTISPEAGVYLTPTRAHEETFERRVAGASLSGVPFELPGGPVSVAIGTEYRKEMLDFNPSPLDLANEYGPVSLKPVSGQYDLAEIFGEVRVPILSDMPFADTLALEAAARYGDYSTVGSVFTWKIGGEYAPVDWVRFRSAYNRAIRAPTLNELFSPVTRGFASGSDPCEASRNPTQAQQELCVAQGVPRAELPTFTQATLGFNVDSGGNPDLTEEKSETFTVGAVISPPFLDRFNLTVDYFQVKVDDAIASINANQTLEDCFTTLDASSATCRAITRLSSGQVDFISTQLQNIGSLKVEGVDVQADYRLDLPAFFELAGDRASLSLQAVGSWLFERSTQLIAGQEPRDCAGRIGGGCTGTGVFATPDFKLNLSAIYDSGPLTLRTQARMIGELTLFPDTVAAVEKAPAEWYFDLSAVYRLHETFELFGGVDNFFDNQPPILGTALAGDANTDPSLYDVLGRRFFIGGRFNF